MQHRFHLPINPFSFIASVAKWSRMRGLQRAVTGRAKKRLAEYSSIPITTAFPSPLPTPRHLTKSAAGHKLRAWEVQPFPHSFTTGKTMRVVLIGAPGVDKLGQGHLLAERYGVADISVAGLLRAAPRHVRDNPTDERIINLLDERLRERDCKRGFVIAGFPRDIPQAQLLDTLLGMLGASLQIAVHLDAADFELVQRAAGRLQCEKCGAVFNRQSRPPKNRGRCDECDGRLSADGGGERAAEMRVMAFREKSAPLFEYYRAQHKLRRVELEGDAAQVHDEICALVDLEIRPLEIPSFETASQTPAFDERTVIAGGQITRIETAEPKKPRKATKAPAPVKKTGGAGKTTARKRPSRAAQPTKKKVAKVVAKKVASKKRAVKKKTAKRIAKKRAPNRMTKKRVIKRVTKRVAKKRVTKRATKRVATKKASKKRATKKRLTTSRAAKKTATKRVAKRVVNKRVTKKRSTASRASNKATKKRTAKRVAKKRAVTKRATASRASNKTTTKRAAKRSVNKRVTKKRTTKSRAQKKTATKRVAKRVVNKRAGKKRLSKTQSSTKRARTKR